MKTENEELDILDESTNYIKSISDINFKNDLKL
jgi:hypothetical protein